MGLVSQIQTLKVSPFVEGEQDIILDGIGRPGGLHQALNVDISREGVVQRGLFPVDASGPTATDVGHLFTTGFYNASGFVENPYVVGVGSGALAFHHNIGGSWLVQNTSWPVATLTDGFGEYWVGMAQANGKVYITTRRAASSWTIDETGAEVQVTSSDFDGTSARFPRAAHIAYHQSLMFAANVQYVTGAVNHKSRLHWSNIEDPETWDAADYIDFDPEDGQEITAIVPFGEDLLVFKDQKVQLLAGRSEASFTRYILTEKYGTFSPKTVLVMGGVVFFADRRHGVVSFDGSGFTVLSEPISWRLRRAGFYGSAPLYQREWAAVAVGDYYYVTLHDSTLRQEHCFALNTITGVWTEHYFGFEAGSYAGPESVYLGNVDTDPFVAGFPNGGFNILGIPFISRGVGGGYPGALDPGATIRTPWYVFSPSGLRGRLRRLTTVWQKPRNVTSTAQIRMYINGSDTLWRSVTIDLDLDTGGGVDDDPFLVQVEPIGGFSDTRFHSIAFEIEFTGRGLNEWACQLLQVALSVSFDTRGRGGKLVEVEVEEGGT